MPTAAEHPNQKRCCREEPRLGNPVCQGGWAGLGGGAGCGPHLEAKRARKEKEGVNEGDPRAGDQLLGVL